MFGSALAGSFVRQRRRDRVLAPLHGYHTTAEMQDGDRIWGRARTCRG